VFLDEGMNYLCAYFGNDSETLTAIIHISIAYYRSCRCAAGKLAFLGNTLETFRFAFNAVLQLTSFGR